MKPVQPPRPHFIGVCVLLLGSLLFFLFLLFIGAKIPDQLGRSQQNWSDRAVCTARRCGGGRRGSFGDRPYAAAI